MNLSKVKGIEKVRSLSNQNPNPALKTIKAFLLLFLSFCILILFTPMYLCYLSYLKNCVIKYVKTKTLTLNK